MAADGGGGIVAPDLFPMLIDERGSRRNRLWVQTRTHVGRDTIARGAAFAGKSASAFAEEKAGFVDFIFQRDV